MKIKMYLKSIVCPCCQSNIEKPIRKSFRQFCPHCNRHIWEVNGDNTKSTLPLRIALFKALVCSSVITLFCVPVWMVCNHYGFDDWLFYNPIMMLLIFATIIGLIWVIEKYLNKNKPKTENYACGVDKLEDFENANITYQAVPACLDCKSKRMVDMFWYKRILLQSETSLAKITIEEKNFVGCLKCHAQYKILPKKVDYTGFYIFITLIFFGVTLFLTYQHVVKVYIENSQMKEFFRLYLSGWAYIFLINIPLQRQSITPVVRLEKIN